MTNVGVQSAAKLIIVKQIRRVGTDVKKLTEAFTETVIDPFNTDGAPSKPVNKSQVQQQPMKSRRVCRMRLAKVERHR